MVDKPLKERNVANRRLSNMLGIHIKIKEISYYRLRKTPEDLRRMTGCPEMDLNDQ